MDKKLEKIGQAFRIEGDYVGYEKIKVGNVNQTYKVTYRREDGSLKNYIVQRVNTYAFRQPEQLMHNVDLITEHIRAKKREGVPCISIIPMTAKHTSMTIKTASGGSPTSSRP